MARVASRREQAVYLRDMRSQEHDYRCPRYARSSLNCPIDNCIYKGLSLANRIQSGGAHADRNCFALSYGPFPTARKVHFDDRESDATMFHGAPPLTFDCVQIEATAFGSSGPA